MPRPRSSTLPETIGASLLAFSTLAAKVIFDPATAVFNDVCRTVMEDTCAWDAASDGCGRAEQRPRFQRIKQPARVHGDPDGASPGPVAAQSKTSSPHGLIDINLNCIRAITCAVAFEMDLDRVVEKRSSDPGRARAS